jgi:transcriptional regulator with GAF, ATPase, and Fis domain
LNEKNDSVFKSGNHDPLGSADDLERARNLLDDLGMPAGDITQVEREGTDDLDRLYEVATSLHGTLDREELFPRILDLAICHAGADRGILFRFDPKTGESSPLVIRDVEGEALDEALRYSRSVLDFARSQEAVHTSDATKDPRFRDAESVYLHKIRSVICVPIGCGEETVGAIYLDSQESRRRLDRKAVRFVGVLAGLSALAIRNAECFADLRRANVRLSHQLGSLDAFEEIIGRSRPIHELLQKLERVASTDFPVLLQGEIGTGKELLARAIHRVSSRREGPFIVQNCAAIPGELLESEFFGHTRGAFTGAHSAREGLFRLADAGTLFLDEIADLDLRLQAKLLRVLEDGMVRPVGSKQEFAVSFRLVSATSIDLTEEVSKGRFREDLYYRLNVVVLRVPPVRERIADIPILIQHFVGKHGEKAGGRTIRFSPAAIRTLQHQPWKGNVREMEHFVKRALVLSEAPTVEAGDLDRYMEKPVREVDSSVIPIGEMTLQEIEDWSIREALRRTNGNKARAAEILGIHRNALLRRLQKMGENNRGND